MISRSNYLYGMLRAADVAKYFGKQRVTVIEVGVASGAGLLNMVAWRPRSRKKQASDCASLVSIPQRPPGDAGLQGSSEIWNSGDFATEDRDKLLDMLDGRAESIWGDIDNNVDSFTGAIDPSAPPGFISIDRGYLLRHNGGIAMLNEPHGEI